MTQLRGQTVQDGGEASIGRWQLVQVVEPDDEAVAVGGREGERDDLAGEQRGDEMAGAALTPECEPRAAK